MSDAAPIGEATMAVLAVRRGQEQMSGLLLRSVAGTPLFAHPLTALDAASSSGSATIVTDDPDVATWASIHGRPVLEVAELPPGLEAVVHLVEVDDDADAVVVVDALLPLVRAATVVGVVDALRRSGAPWLVATIEDQGRFWNDVAGHEDADGRAGRVYRVVPHLRAFARAALEVASGPAKGGGIAHVIGAEEALELRGPTDLIRVHHALERGTVVFRLRANRLIGSGHLYHCLRLAEELHDQELWFLLVDCDDFAGELLTARGQRYRAETLLVDDLAAMRGTGAAALVVNDVLDTTEEVVTAQRSAGYRVVNIEDLGPGARLADWVVNALYPLDTDARSHVASGGRYATLRNEFRHLPPKVVRAKPERILVTFGGTDPGRLASRFTSVLAATIAVEITVIIGPGAGSDAFPSGCRVLRSPRSMAAEMIDADLVLTSAGRTVYEAAATGTPVVVVAQNAREATHTHLGFDSGTIFLGLGALVTDEQVASVVQRVLADDALRRELSRRLRSSVDGLGAERIAQGIRNLLRGIA